MFEQTVYRTTYHNGPAGAINIALTGWFKETWVLLAGGKCAMLVHSQRSAPPVYDKFPKGA